MRVVNTLQFWASHTFQPLTASEIVVVKPCKLRCHTPPPTGGNQTNNPVVSALLIEVSYTFGRISSRDFEVVSTLQIGVSYTAKKASRKGSLEQVPCKLGYHTPHYCALH